MMQLTLFFRKFTRNLMFLGILINALSASAQNPQVPHKIYFADLTLELNDQVRREIQLDVDALYRNPTFFKTKMDRFLLYKPFIERELQAQGVPLDIQYLVIQESGLIADAVSTSNAVGFWQFKKGTAEEVFMRVDQTVDERKNIVSSSRGAALYLKKHHSHLNNWMVAVVSYQMGLGGAKSYFGNEFHGKKVVHLDRNSHWYFKKFLAHKIAFENPTYQLASQSEYLEELQIQGPISLKNLAQRVGVNERELAEYNRWILNDQIPGDKPYTLIYRKSGSMPPKVVLADNTNARQNPSFTTLSSPFPVISGNTQQADQPDQIKINDIKGIKATSNSSFESLSRTLGIPVKKLKRYNDLSKNDKIVEGEYYYYEPKDTQAAKDEHVVMPGETLWKISQRYGIKLSTLKAKNRIRKDEDLRPGMVLLLNSHRKRGEDIKMIPVHQELKSMVAQQKSQATSTTNKVETPVVNTPTQNVSTTSNSPTPTSGTSEFYQVSAGDTLFRISQKYGVTVDDLKKWNNLMDNNIKVGQRLKILK
jgi:membrane-bound lytic murein transglycosylase D